MDKLSPACVLSLVVCLAAGCRLPEAADEPPEAADEEEGIVGEAAGEIAAANSLVPNSLVPNSLVPNSLVPGELTPEALAPDVIAALQDPGPDGDAVRQLLRYVVGCALAEGQSFAFSWTDAAGVTHDEVYEGALGIAPGWATGPLSDDTAQRLVSACLAARVNWYGIAVVISVRSGLAPLMLAPGSSELAAYPHVEGAFWGNLFAPSPYLNACYLPENAEIARAAHRDCAVGHVEDPGQSGAPVPCGIIALTGPCGASCKALDSQTMHYAACVDRPGVPDSPTTAAVITTALP